MLDEILNNTFFTVYPQILANFADARGTPSDERPVDIGGDGRYFLPTRYIGDLDVCKVRRDFVGQARVCRFKQIINNNYHFSSESVFILGTFPLADMLLISIKLITLDLDVLVNECFAERLSEDLIIL